MEAKNKKRKEPRKNDGAVRLAGEGIRTLADAILPQMMTDVISEPKGDEDRRTV